MDRKEVKGIADVEAAKAVKGHEKKMHGMKKGGVTSLDMKKYGRNLARAMNQKSTGRGR
jgi:hypothetical protein